MRQVTINGKTVILETGKAIPPRVAPGKPKGSLRLLLEMMQPGESAFLPITNEKNRISSTLSDTGKATGRHFGYRREGDGVRVFCTARKPSPAKPQPAARAVVLANGVSW